jgi:hypothetical protein
MDLDDELDDFDGGEDYDYDGEDGYAEGKQSTHCHPSSIMANVVVFFRTE